MGQAKLKNRKCIYIFNLNKLKKVFKSFLKKFLTLLYIYGIMSTS